MQPRIYWLLASTALVIAGCNAATEVSLVPRAFLRASRAPRPSAEALPSTNPASRRPRCSLLRAQCFRGTDELLFVLLRWPTNSLDTRTMLLGDLAQCWCSGRWEPGSRLSLFIS
ncbi:hypothetical protein KM043_001132 [Ampulex compressa]|nr:hypothetical protein KM043_001132 [Ampulex compressa]